MVPFIPIEELDDTAYDYTYNDTTATTFAPITKNNAETTTGTGTDEETADSLFAKALTALSFQDRNTIEDEIHGVSSIAIQETPDLLARSLREFEMELHQSHPKPAYDKAQELHAARLSIAPDTRTGCYLTTHKFRLRFLRCELFDVHKAVARYLHYVEFIRDVYGDYALLRPIRMNDLTHEELIFFKEGQHQILPYCDRSGRRIIGIVPQHTKTKHITKQLLRKVHFYLFNACAGGCDTTHQDTNNVECHQKGIVVVYFPSWQHQLESVPTSLQRTKLQVQSQVAHIVPLRIVCLHACFPNTQLYQVYGKVIAMLSSTWQSRTKIHVGSPVEWRYALQSYGIPTQFIPLTHTGNIKLDKWKQWIKCKAYTEQLDTQERTANNTSSGESTTVASAAAAASASAVMRNQHLQTIVDCPGSTDVLFRRGRSVDFHPGNNMFQNMLAAHLAHHAHPSTTPLQQRAIERSVIRQVQQQGQAMGHGGRFLKWEVHQGWWSDMSKCSVVNVNVNVHGNNNNNNNNRSQSVDDTDMITTVSCSVDSSTNNGGDTTSSRRSSPMTSVSTTPSKNGTIHTANNNRNNASSRRKEGEWKEQAANPEIQAKVHYAFRDFKIKIKRRAQQQQQKQQEQQQQQQQNNNSSVIEQPVTTHHSCSHLTSAFMNMNERQDGQQQQKRKRSSSNNNNNNSTHRIDDADDSGSTHSDDRTTSSDRMFCMPFLSDHKNSRNTCGYFPLEEN